MIYANIKALFIAETPARDCEQGYFCCLFGVIVVVILAF